MSTEKLLELIEESLDKEFNPYRRIHLINLRKCLLNKKGVVR